MAAQLDLLLNAKDRFLKSDGEVFADVIAPLRARSATPTTARAGAEHIAEDVTKDVIQVDVLESAAGKATSAIQSCMAKAVVGRPLVRVREYAVSFTGFFEAVFCFGCRIAVWMELHRQLAVCGLQVHFSTSAAYAQDLVIVFFRFCRHSAHFL